MGKADSILLRACDAPTGTKTGGNVSVAARFLPSDDCYLPLTRIWSNDSVMVEVTVPITPPHVGAQASCSQVLLPDTYCMLV